MSGDAAEEELQITISSDGDLLSARRRVRKVAVDLGFSLTEVIGIVTALSELARNMLMYAGRGELCVRTIHTVKRVGLEIVATDNGPGIPDIQKALVDGYSTSGGLGMGLSGTRRLMDDFEIVSQPQKGTTVRVKKWLNHW